MEIDPQAPDDQAETGSPEPRPSPENGSVRHKFVSFFLGEKYYAMPANAVTEIVGRLTPTRLPDAPPALLGIAPLRGDILAVIDAGSDESLLQNSKQKAVVLRPQAPSIELPVAFNVDRVGELLQIGEDDIRFAASEDPLATFESNVNGKPVLIIEPARIQNFLSATEQ